MKGRWLIVEGSEGTGKGTAITYITSLLAAKGIAHICTREPGGTPIAEEIRTLVKGSHDEDMSSMCELLLFYAARSQVIENLIKPALERGDWVVSDRSWFSTVAYQCAGRGLDRALVDNLNERIVGNVAPDRVILLDAPLDVAMARVDSRGERDRIEQEDRDFFERVRSAYIDLSDSPEWTLIDASKEIGEVHRCIASVVLDMTPSYKASPIKTVSRGYSP